MADDTALHWSDILLIVLYFVICLGVGLVASIRATRGTSQGYFLAGQSTNWLLIGASTFATNIGAPMFVGLAGSAAATGLAVVMFEWHAMLMLVALGWLFLPVYRAAGCYTMPEYLKLRYGGGRIRLIIACLHTVNTIISSVSGQMYAGALFIQQIFDWNIYLAVAAILGITAIYTIMGGLKAVMWTDAAQTIILVIGSFALGFISLNEVGGFEALRNRYMEAASDNTIASYALYGNVSCGLPPQNAFHIFRAADDGSYPWPGLIFGLTILATNAWCTDQVCVQRSLAAKNVAHAKGGALLAAYLKIAPFLFFVIPGMISRVLFPDEVACSDPDKCREICENPNGCSNIAYPLLVMRILPRGLKGLMMAAMLAALMSSLTSIFNSSSTIFTMDIWKRIRPKAKERELMVIGRLYTLLLVGVSIAWLPIFQIIQGSAFWDFVQSIYSHILPPIVSSFILGIFWTRTTEKGAFWGIVVGTVVGVTRMILTWIRPGPPCGSTDEDKRWPIISNVHYLHFAVILFAVAAVVQIIVSLLTKPRPPEKLRRVTFWTKDDPLPQELSDSEFDDDENEKDEEQNLNKGEDDDKVMKCLKNYLCGLDSKPAKRMTKAELIERRQKLTDIYEDPKQARMLNGLAILTVGVCVFLHGFWY